MIAQKFLFLKPRQEKSQTIFVYMRKVYLV